MINITSVIIRASVCVFQNRQTVTLGIDDIDLFPCHFCDIFYDILIAFTQESLSLQQKPKYICI